MGELESRRFFGRMQACQLQEFLCKSLCQTTIQYKYINGKNMLVCMCKMFKTMLQASLEVRVEILAMVGDDGVTRWID